MITVKVTNPPLKTELINPRDMFTYKAGTIFQEYANGKPQKWFFVSLGCAENLLTIWYSDEDKRYLLATDTKKDVAELLPHVKCKVVDMTLSVLLENN